MHKSSPFPPPVAFAAVLSVLLSCGDSTGPGAQKVLTPGVTVSGRVEAVDRPAEYTLPVKTGDEFAVYFQSFKRGLTLTVIDPRANRVLGQAVDLDSAGTLTDVRTTLIRVDTDGSLLVRVAAQPEVDFGEFRLLIASVPRQPEAHTAHITLNDTVSESLDSDIDVDEFTLDAAATDEIVLFFKVGNGATGILLHLLAPDGTPVGDVGAVGPAADFELGSSGRITLPASGRYRVRVDQWGRAAPVPYTFQVRRVDRQPERVAATIAPGDTVDSELLDHVGDLDEFVIAGAPGDAYNVFAQSPGPASNVVRVEVFGPANAGLAGVEVNPGETLTGGATGAFVLPVTGRVTVRVSGAFDRFGLYRGPYRLFAYRIDPGPEHAPALLESAVTVSERIELPGDVDRFSLTLAGDGVANVVVRRPPGDGAGLLQLHVRRPGETGDIGYALAYAVPSPEEIRASTGNLHLAAGSYVVEVDGYSSKHGGFVGAYELTAFRIDPAPEHRPATIAIGDTVGGESIDHIGDVDVFSFAGAAGQRVRVLLRAGVPPWGDGALAVELLDPATGAILASATARLSDGVTDVVELPASRDFMVRVRGVRDTHDAAHYSLVLESP